MLLSFTLSPLPFGAGCITITGGAWRKYKMAAVAVARTVVADAPSSLMSVVGTLRVTSTRTKRTSSVSTPSGGGGTSATSDGKLTDTVSFTVVPNPFAAA